MIHGTDDPVLPYPHGVALAAQIPGARLITLEGAGHELHRSNWDTLAAAILEQTCVVLASRAERLPLPGSRADGVS